MMLHRPYLRFTRKPAITPWHGSTTVQYRHKSSTSPPPLFQNVRGTHDIIPATHLSRCFQWIERCARHTANRFGYHAISTPVIEYMDIFNRTLGTDSDVVMKEMYTLASRSGQSKSHAGGVSLEDVPMALDEDVDRVLCLRPEMTAAVVRSVVQNRLTVSLPQKFYYMGPMFRHERPQKGRYRQFHQFGVEHIGSEHPHSDVEVIDLACQFLTELGLWGKEKKHNITLEINSIGDGEDRARYREVLSRYLSQNRQHLSDKSRTKFDRGSVLRVLDSNEQEDREVIQEAPQLVNSMSEDCLKRFETVLEGLEWLDIPYTVNPLLVRGLDYYAHTTFEFKDYGLGSKPAVLSGGRYDGLIEQMGGPHTPAIGWACGMERISQLLDEKYIAEKVASVRPIVVVAMLRKPLKYEQRSETPRMQRLMADSNKIMVGTHEKSEREGETEFVSKFCLQLSQQLRQEERMDNVHYMEKGNFQKQLSYANRINARIAVIVGSAELERNVVQVKDFDQRTQEEVPISELIERLKLMA